jgi:hypothetical protein
MQYSDPWKYPNPSKHRIVLFKIGYFCHMLLYKFTEKILLLLTLCINLQLFHYTDKKKIKLSSYIKKFRVEQLQSHIYIRRGFLIYEEMRANISPYMRRPLFIYDFATAPFWISLYMRII